MVQEGRRVESWVVQVVMLVAVNVMVHDEKVLAVGTSTSCEEHLHANLGGAAALLAWQLSRLWGDQDHCHPVRRKCKE